MGKSLKLELNIALIPDDQLAWRLATVSHQLARQYPATIQLGHTRTRLAMAPHLTLDLLALWLADIEAAADHLTGIAAGRSPFQLKATRYVYNNREASLEVGYETPPSLVTLQEDIISRLNPLRGELLLERDPAGQELRPLLQQPGQLGDNLRRTGYAEVGDPMFGRLFRPHATLNWFELGTEVDINASNLPPVSTLSGYYSSLGMFALGPNGSCPQLLAEWPLSGEPRI